MKKHFMYNLPFTMYNFLAHGLGITQNHISDMQIVHGKWYMYLFIHLC